MIRRRKPKQKGFIVLIRRYRVHLLIVGILCSYFYIVYTNYFVKHNNSVKVSSITTPKVKETYQNQATENIPHLITKSNEPNIVIRSSIGNDDDDDALIGSLKLFNRKGHLERVDYLIGGLGIDRDYKTDIKYSIKPRVLENNIYERNYDNQPILMSGYSANAKASNFACHDLPCTPCTHGGCDSKGKRFTMENIAIGDNFLKVRKGKGGVIIDEYSLSGNTKLYSQIPVPYFSYHDFGIFEHVEPKTEKSLGAAFISNCRFNRRNNMVRDLQKFGVPIDSYGRCEHNANEGASRSQNSKIGKLKNYKFALAFENSETLDYITEKFWESLCAGAIPVVIGAPNSKFFAPDTGPFPLESKSIIMAKDFDYDAQKLANHLKYLDRNDTAYKEYLSWKTTGYSDDYKALVDLTDATSQCRSCIEIADLLRRDKGISRYDLTKMQKNVYRINDSQKEHKTLLIRERGNYIYHEIKFFSDVDITLKDLIAGTLKFIKPRQKNLWKNNDDKRNKPTRVYAFYHKFERIPIVLEEHFKLLPSFSELEVIFT